MKAIALILASAWLINMTYGQQTASEPDPRDQIEKAAASARTGEWDRAYVLLMDAAARAAKVGDKETASQAQFGIAELFRQSNRPDRVVETLVKAAPQAAGTTFEHMFSANIHLSRSEIARNEEDFLQSLEHLRDAAGEIEMVPNIESRESLESERLTAQANLYVRAADRVDASKPAAELPRSMQGFLVATLRDTAAEKIETSPQRGEPIPAKTIQWLDRQRPWDRALIEAALRVNAEVTTLDERRPASISAFEVAKDRSLSADLHARLGVLDKAIQLKQEAFEVFLKNNLFQDGVAALSGLIDFHLARKTRADFVEALDRSKRLIRMLENQTLELAGHSVGAFLRDCAEMYARHYFLLLKQYDILLEERSTNTNRGLAELLLHADRLQFRAARRDASVYRELAEKIGPVPDLIEQLNEQAISVFGRQAEVDRTLDQGKEPADFPDSDRMGVSSPFRALENAKRELIEVFENYKRRHVHFNEAIRLPKTLDEVAQGMVDDEAIIMFFVQPPPRPALRAAVITAGAQSRLVEFDAGLLESLPAAAAKLRQEITSHSPKARDSLAKFAETLWLPLGELPARLTIILAPAVIGIPFDCLPLPGEVGPVITQHTLRYAFGFGPALGHHAHVTPPKKAMVVGAENFPTSNDSSLEAAGEVGAVREFLAARGIALVPENDGLPSSAKPLFFAQSNPDVVHISTHSRLDRGLPLLDRLVFPADQIAAYELGLSRTRAQLAVFSACELFTPRSSDIDPVSGITTSGLARVAPQVVSTRWRVNAAATLLFNLRFYDALLEGNDPSASLALTKRDFIHPKRLDAWMRSNKMSAPKGFDANTSHDPYFWAPFALVVAPR